MSCVSSPITANDAATCSGDRNGLSNSPMAAFIRGFNTGTSSGVARRWVRAVDMRYHRPVWPKREEHFMDVQAIVRRTWAQTRALPKRDTPSLRTVRKALSVELRHAPARDVVAVGEALAQTTPRWLGLEVITNHRAALASLTLTDVERLGLLDSWYSVDAYGIYISGPAWRDGQIGIAANKRREKFRDFWWRRAALVSTVALNAKSHGNGYRTADTLAICEMLIDDREDMVVKALSWALRVLASRDPVAVRAFLEQHKGRLAARVKRECRLKLETGKKNQLKKKPKAGSCGSPNRTGLPTVGYRIPSCGTH